MNGSESDLLMFTYLVKFVIEELMMTERLFHLCVSLQFNDGVRLQSNTYVTIKLLISFNEAVFIQLSVE